MTIDIKVMESERELLVLATEESEGVIGYYRLNFLEGPLHTDVISMLFSRFSRRGIPRKLIEKAGYALKEKAKRDKKRIVHNVHLGCDNTINSLGHIFVENGYTRKNYIPGVLADFEKDYF